MQGKNRIRSNSSNNTEPSLLNVKEATKKRKAKEYVKTCIAVDELRASVAIEPDQ